MDTADEFGSLFDDAISAAPLSHQRQASAPEVADEWGLDVTSGFATFHEEPEPALPSTDGAEDEDDWTDHVAARHIEPQRSPVAPPAPRRAPAPAQRYEGAEERGRRLLAYADAIASGQEVDGPNPFEHLGAGQADNEMAAAASRFLSSKTALKDFSLAERQAIIDEGEGGEPANNFDRLDISGTHYEALEAVQSKAASEDDDLWLLGGDPNDMGDGM